METVNLKMKEGKKRAATPKLIKIAIAVAVLVLILAGGGLFVYKMGYLNTFKIARQLQKMQQVSKDDQKILAKLGEIMVLPSDVTPTMALVSDAEKLKAEQPAFFADVKNGDRLIIYPNQAIIFDADANKIVKVGAVQFGAIEVNVAVLNGATDSTRETEVIEKIGTSYGNAKIKTFGQTISVYDKTLVVDLSGKGADLNDFADKIGGEVAPMPEGEQIPEGAQILVIVGQM